MEDGTHRLRTLSKLLFGNADRLEVAAAIARAEPGGLFSRALAEDLDLPDNRVQKQLKQFEAADLLVALPAVGGERRVYCERKDSFFWAAADRLEKQWRDGVRSSAGSE